MTKFEASVKLIKMRVVDLKITATIAIILHMICGKGVSIFRFLFAIIYFKLNEGEYESIPAHSFQHHVLRPDSYWECAFGINVYEEQGRFHQKTIILGMLFKKNKDNKFLVKLIEYEEEFEIVEGNQADYQKFL